MLIYVSSYANVDKLVETGNAIAKSGNSYICPELMVTTLQIEQRLQILVRCDGIWRDSEADPSPVADAEWSLACALEMPYWEDGGVPQSPHPTEVACPQQTQAFMTVLMRAYRLHLDKHADYGNAGYLGTGEIGVVTRLWEKVARIMNLYGFRFDISNPRMESSKFPLNEAVEKTWEDLIVYPIVAILLRHGQWGK